MDQPLVSVIMNCLNCSQHLADCMDSLMQQSYTNFEVVFFDNASTDGSACIATQYGEKIRCFHGQTTVPLGAARNLAIREAKGDLIAFLDCDDLWRSEKLRQQVDLFVKDPSVGLVTTDTILFDGKKELGRVFATAKPARGCVYRELMQRQWISMSSAMVSRKALNTLCPDQAMWFDERLNVCEEADVFYRIAHDWKLDFVDAPLTLWRIHGKNTTFTKYAQFAAETRIILDKHRKLYADFEQNYPDLIRLLTERATFQQAVATWQNGDGKTARDLLASIQNPSRKTRLFSLATYLPQSTFPILVKLYFAFAKWLRS